MSSHMDRIIRKAAKLASEGKAADAWRLVEPLSGHVPAHRELAEAWTALASFSSLDDDVRATAEEILRAWPDDRTLVVGAASVLSEIAEQRPFDEPPLDDGPARLAADTLRRLIDSLSLAEKNDPEIAAELYSHLAMALRMTGSQDDDAAMEAMREALRLRPEDGSLWFQLGLLCKWRGRWEEGVEANQRARELGAETEGVLWNLAICAMGAGFYPLAGSVMKELGMKGSVNDEGIFTGGFDTVQIRVSSLGEGIDPRAHVLGGEPDFEHLWIERMSLVHGAVVNASLYDLPVDFGDIVLFDGAAVGWRDDGEGRIPRFPLLQKLKAGPWRRYRFRARQPRAGFLEDVSKTLPGGAFFYVHDEQVNLQCRSCATEGRSPHDHVHPESTIVSGKLVVPEHLINAKIVQQIDAALGQEAIIAVPRLHEDLGDAARAEREHDLWNELQGEESGMEMIVCETHGRAEAAYVCCHLVEGEQRGFFAAEDDSTLRPDAWCGACERVRLEEGGVWNDRSEGFANVRLICGACYDAAKTRNLRRRGPVSGKRPWWRIWG